MHPADSSAQGIAEEAIRNALNEREGWTLTPQRVYLEDGDAAVEVDGIDYGAKVAVEIVARMGERSASRDHKIISDATKLWLLKHKLGSDFRIAIAGADEAFLSRFKSPSLKWQTAALRRLGVEIIVVPVADETSRLVQEAQRAQAKGNRTDD